MSSLQQQWGDFPPEMADRLYTAVGPLIDQYNTIRGAHRFRAGRGRRGSSVGCGGRDRGRGRDSPTGHDYDSSDHANS